MGPYARGVTARDEAAWRRGQIAEALKAKADSAVAHYDDDHEDEENEEPIRRGTGRNKRPRRDSSSSD